MDSSTLTEMGVYQGVVLSVKALPENVKNVIQDGRACKRKRLKPLTNSHLLVVLSQDCDIAATADAYLELLTIKLTPESKSSPNLHRGINYRKLQFKHNEKLYEAEAELISIIEKKELLGCTVKIESILETRVLNLLIDWRVGRYRRRPLPDKFNREFLQYLKDPDNELSQYMESQRDEIREIFLHVTPRDEEDAQEYQVIVNGIVFDNSPIKGDFEKLLSSHLKILQEANNSLNFPQISLIDFAPEEDIPMDLVYEAREYSLSDVGIMTELNLNYMCHDE